MSGGETAAAQKEAFLQSLAAGHSVTRAAEQAGLARSTAYGWRKSDAAFAQGWEDAMEASADLLEDEARRRAVEGVEETLFYGGKPVGQVRKYSDSLLAMLLKGRRPSVFRERISTELSGPGGGAVQLSDAERTARITALLRGAEDRLKKKE